MMNEDDFRAAVNAYLTAIEGFHKWDRDTHFPTLAYDELRWEEGSRYIRVFLGTSVFCFIDKKNGDILKAATYKAPQKNGVRGNVLFDIDRNRLVSRQSFYVR